MEIKNYGHNEQKKKLIAGIVLTGGGSQLNHLKQLVEYITGMDTRIGFPGEHLASETINNISSPMFATSVGLLMNALEHNESNMDNETGKVSEENENKFDDINKEINSDKINRKSIFENWGDKLKEFLDNA